MKLLLALALTGLVGIVGVARADIDGDQFESAEWGVRLTAPSHWQMSERTSYPNILLWMTHNQPAGRMLLSVEMQDEKMDAESYARRTSKVLEELGFTVRKPQRHAATGAWYYDFDNCNGAADCNGKVFMRQGFLVHEQTGYALTLAAPDVYARGRLLPSWDRALRSIQITSRTGEAAE